MEVKNVGTSLKHYKSHNDYVAAKKTKALSTATKELAAGELPTENINPTSVEEGVKSEISEASKSLSKNSSKSNILSEATKMVGTEALKAGLSQLKPAVAMAKNIAKGRASTKMIDGKPESVVKEAPRKEPLVIFFTGFEMLSTDSDAGLRKLAEHIPNAKVMGWTDEDEAIAEIKKYHSQAPLILGGHSLGSDTAVNITQALNTLDHGFRKVDLLVTLDSIGADNDVIPTNTTKNINFIGDEQGYLNDGPNIARNLDITEVINELRPEDHLDIDNENSVMKKIFQEVMPIIENYEV